MNKDELLTSIEDAARSGLVHEGEVQQAWRRGADMDASVTAEKDGMHIGVPEILYFIGGAIVFIGIGVLIYQHWVDLTSFARILVTLGSGLAAYIAAALFSRYEKLGGVSQAFFLISGLVLPIGLFVAFNEGGTDTGDPAVHSIITALLFLAFTISALVYRKTILTVFSIAFGVWLFYAATSWLVGGRPNFNALEFNAYRTLAVGASLLLLGYSFAQRNLRVLTRWLYAIGSVMFLAAALVLGGWEPEQNVFWELIFPVLSLGAAFLSIHLRSTALLVFGSLFLMIYIGKITAEYFADTIGWPFALVIAGLALIAIGYGAFYLHQEYLPRRARAKTDPSHG